MKLWAISDLHVRHAENRAALEAAPARPADWLILGGDLGETEEHLAFVLDTLGPKYARLLWVPGNHELWSSGELKGEAKYLRLVDLCRARGVLVRVSAAAPRLGDLRERAAADLARPGRPSVRAVLARARGARRRASVSALQRRGSAGLLAVVAIAGFLALPLLHAESHAGAEARAKAEAHRVAFALGFTPHRSGAQEAALRQAAALAFGPPAATEPQTGNAPLHLHDGAPVHSHGGPAHGAGALEHLSLAIAAASPPAALTVQLSVRASDARAPQPAPLVARYLVPRFAQGPPQG